MYADPQEEARDLAESYRSMSDEQLTELAESFADLRPIAQQMLHNEMALRKLGDPLSKDWGRCPPPEPLASSQIEVPQGDEVEFTWKTPLCGCESQEQSWQIREVLRRARIESWMDAPGGSAAGALRILVAADQLEDAQRVIANPIPADVVEESKMTPPEYDVPVCPKCGTSDPILIDVEPVNTWECESCGAEWTDPA